MSESVSNRSLADLLAEAIRLDEEVEKLCDRITILEEERKPLALKSIKAFRAAQKKSGMDNNHWVQYFAKAVERHRKENG